MTYTLDKNTVKGEFSVPDYIVDKHLKLASGEQLKVLLLILRKAPKALTAAEIAKALRYSQSDVEDYLQYWILMGVITENDEEGGSDSAPVSEPEEKPEESIHKPVPYIPASSPAPAQEAAPVTIKESKTPEYILPTHAEIAARISESREIAGLFTELQTKLGKTLGHDGQCVFLMLHDHYGLPVEVLFMLVDYCVSISKTGYSYIEKVGKNWAENEIDTIDKAAEKIKSLGTVEVFWKKFTAETGISNPKPTAAQTASIEHWLNDLKVSEEVIYRAYEEMANHTGKLSFSYMNKVIENWASKGLKTTEDIDRAEKNRTDAKKSAKQNSQGGASYNLDEYTAKATYRKPTYERKKK